MLVSAEGERFTSSWEKEARESMRERRARVLTKKKPMRALCLRTVTAGDGGTDDDVVLAGNSGGRSWKAASNVMKGDGWRWQKERAQRGRERRTGRVAEVGLDGGARPAISGELEKRRSTGQLVAPVVS